VTFQGELRPDQKLAAEAMLEHDTGVLAATTAFGKTVIAASLIARRGVNALVLVHRRQLLDTSGSSGCRRSSTCQRSLSVESEEGEVGQPAHSMWRSFRVLSGKVSSMTALPSTDT
jgi:superfamily II DNA or RNA helicase